MDTIMVARLSDSGFWYRRYEVIASLKNNKNLPPINADVRRCICIN